MTETSLQTKNAYCTFYLDHLYFGVKVVEVQEVIRQQQMTCVPLAPTEVTGLMNLRGQIVMAIDLRKRLQLPERNPDQPIMNVVISGQEGAISLLVDEIGDVIEVSENQFEPPPETLQGVPRELILGAYKLDGKLLLLLDTYRAVEELNGMVSTEGMVATEATA